MNEQERDGLLRLLEREVNSGNLLALYRDGRERLMLETRHGTIVRSWPVVHPTSSTHYD
jgi:hypothetical protein